jgi:hypothetical protein
MPLPKITIPKYPVIIPSSKKKTFFRPFLMKEQKILFMALESKEIDQMFRAMCDIVRNCVDNIEDPETIPMFDLEYIFAKIRAKSIGESVDVVSKCPKCEHGNKLTIEIDSIEVQFPEGITNKIMLNDKLGVMLRYPCLKDAAEDLNSLGANEIISFICNAIDTVFDETTVYSRKDFGSDEIREFVESLNTQQFDAITKFYTNLPQLNKTVPCTCAGCQHEYTVDFRGLQDFFT